MIFEPYRISQDENNYIIQQRAERKNGDEYWKTLAYYGIGELDLALKNMLNRRIHSAQKDEIKHVLKVLVDTKREILNAITKVKVEAVMGAVECSKK